MWGDNRYRSIYHDKIMMSCITIMHAHAHVRVHDATTRSGPRSTRDVAGRGHQAGSIACGRKALPDLLTPFCKIICERAATQNSHRCFIKACQTRPGCQVDRKSLLRLYAVSCNRNKFHFFKARYKRLTRRYLSPY